MAKPKKRKHTKISTWQLLRLQEDIIKKHIRQKAFTVSSTDLARHFGISWGKAEKIIKKTYDEGW